jgi:hypothetical protein
MAAAAPVAAPAPVAELASAEPAAAPAAPEDRFALLHVEESRHVVPTDAGPRVVVIRRVARSADAARARAEAVHLRLDQAKLVKLAETTAALRNLRLEKLFKHVELN